VPAPDAVGGAAPAPSSSEDPPQETRTSDAAAAVTAHLTAWPKDFMGWAVLTPAKIRSDLRSLTYQDDPRQYSQVAILRGVIVTE
jgi:cytochrome c-type biogenesis protein CcmH/NrfG